LIGHELVLREFTLAKAFYVVVNQIPYQVSRTKDPVSSKEYDQHESLQGLAFFHLLADLMPSIFWIKRNV